MFIWGCLAPIQMFHFTNAKPELACIIKFDSQFGYGNDCVKPNC